MSRYAYASKHQLKVWASASRYDKDYPRRPTDNVMFEVKKTNAKDGIKAGYIATVTATDGYQLMRRNVQTDNDATEPIKISIPREAVEKAEKAMKLGDRCYFDDRRLEVVEVTRDKDTDEELEQTVAMIPFVEQLDLFIDLDSPIEAEANKDVPEKVVTLDAKVLKKVVDQFKSGDALCYVTLHFKGEMDGVIIKAWEGIDDEELTAVVMPTRS